MHSENKQDDKTQANKAALEELLRRGDVWRGHSQYFAPQQSVDSGYTALNASLLNKGWPLGALVEVGLPSLQGYCEWHLLMPVLQKLKQDYLILLNPPALPFAPRLLQLGLDLDRLIVVRAANKSDFLSGFIELARSPSCAVLMAWQPKQNLSYTDLRKCLLAATDNSALQLLFRHQRSLQNSSPATLRLFCQWQPGHLQISITKQKGVLLKHQQAVELPLPLTWPKPEEFEVVQEEQAAVGGAQIINLNGFAKSNSFKKR